MDDVRRPRLLARVMLYEENVIDDVRYFTVSNLDPPMRGTTASTLSAVVRCVPARSATDRSHTVSGRHVDG
ncbi:hypothetical protein J6590_084917 [Homalodisca vitripennis]|nr:hypothetical protein J6590_084917 [Homalodisca vitripennis]